MTFHDISVERGPGFGQAGPSSFGRCAGARRMEPLGDGRMIDGGTGRHMLGPGRTVSRYGSRGERAMKPGRVAFGRMEAVSFGVPLEQAVAEEAERLGAERIFLMVSGTLNRETGEIEKLRRALGNKVAGHFDRMAPHTPRRDVMAATEAARAVDADLIVTFGGGSLTDGAKAVRMCLANDIRTPEEMDALRDPAAGPAIPQVLHPDHAFGRRVQRHCGRHRRACEAEGAVPPSRRHPERGHPRPGADGPHAGMALPLHRRARGGPLRRGRVLRRGACLWRCAGAPRAGAADRRARAGQGGCGRHRGAPRLPGGFVALDGPARGGRADGRQPRHRLCAGARCSTRRTATPPASCCPS